MLVIVELKASTARPLNSCINSRNRWRTTWAGGRENLAQSAVLTEMGLPLRLIRRTPRERLKMPLRIYVSIAILFSVVLIVRASGSPQDIRTKPSWRSPPGRQATAADAELARLRADVLDKMKESRASAEKLMALHEEEKKKISAEYESRKELYRQGLIAACRT